MFAIGSLIDTVTDKLGLPEVLGDVAKIGVGIAMKDHALIADGVIDITPNVCDFLEKELDLGAAEPGEPDSLWKQLGRGALEVMRKEAERAEQLPPLLQGAAGGVGPQTAAGIGSDGGVDPSKLLASLS